MRRILAVLALGTGLVLATSSAWAQFRNPQSFAVPVTQIPLGTGLATSTVAAPSDQEGAPPPQRAVIEPGRGIGPARLGMPATYLVHALGRAGFEGRNDDGSTVYEWGLLSGGELPDALLWVVVDSNGIVAKVGTDAGRYQTSAGLRVGISAEEFAKQYGRPTNNPGRGRYVFPQGIGIVVESSGTVVSIWTELGAQPALQRI